MGLFGNRTYTQEVDEQKPTSAKISVSYKELIEAFTIFSKYGEAETIVRQHTLVSGQKPDITSKEDLKRLSELGWHPNYHGKNFIKHA